MSRLTRKSGNARLTFVGHLPHAVVLLARPPVVHEVILLELREVVELRVECVVEREIRQVLKVRHAAENETCKMSLYDNEMSYNDSQNITQLAKAFALTLFVGLKSRKC